MLALRGAIEEVATVVRRLGVTLDPQQIGLLERYAAMLREWNERINLTAIVEPREIAVKHFLDSLSGLAVRRWHVEESVVDVGTGAGFPGVPLAVALRGLRVTLVESVGKKVRFLEAVRDALGLAAVRIAHARAEELAHDGAHRERYDVAVARALPDLAANLELLLPFVRAGGDAIVYKGRVEDELATARRAAAALGGEVARVVPTTQLGLGETLPGRTLVLARKTRPTSARYPRRHVEMKRRPW